MFSEEANFRVAIAASADLYNGDPTSDYFDMSEYEEIAFVVHHGNGATGRATYTVAGASDNSGTGAEDIGYRYRAHGATAAVGDLTEVAAAGYTIAAGANQLVVIEVKADQLPDGKQFVALTATETVDSPVPGSVLAVMTKPRHTDGNPPSALA